MAENFDYDKAVEKQLAQEVGGEQVHETMQQRKTFIVIDIIMVFLLLLNLLWLAFDWSYAKDSVNSFYKEYTPGLHTSYEIVHEHADLIDLIFISIFILEFLIRWIVALVLKEYDKWFFYPFIHWYDVIGCIPVAGFRMLRVLRLLAIIYRFQKLGYIDINKSYFYRLFTKYYEIFVEEVSDRVVIHVLDNVKEEVKMGGVFTERLIKEVLMPQQDNLTKWVEQRVTVMAQDYFIPKKDGLISFIDEIITKSLDKNPDFHQMKQIPLVGDFVSKRLAGLISNIVFNAIEELINKASDKTSDEMVGTVLELSFDYLLSADEDESLRVIIRNIMMQTIDLLKDQVSVKQWKLKEEQERLEKQMEKEEATQPKII